MTELILSDVTRMTPGLCIIGIEPRGSGFGSVRPCPPRRHAWPSTTFSFRRGDRLEFRLSEAEVVPPHVEDRRSAGTPVKLGQIAEPELIRCLRKAEMAARLRDLFGLPVQMKRRGAYIWPKRGSRSICGVEAARIRVFLEGREIRATVGFPSGETLPNLKVVDHSWNTFVETALKQVAGLDGVHRLNQFFEERLRQAPPEQCFVRIGVTRATPVCWLMVDSLFPVPRQSWLQDLLAGGAGAREAQP